MAMSPKLEWTPPKEGKAVDPGFIEGLMGFCECETLLPVGALLLKLDLFCVNFRAEMPGG
jgi:hypothetical protein